MGEYVDVDLLKSKADITNWGTPYGCSLKLINSLPTISNLNREYGKWISETVPCEDGTGTYRIIKCSKCGQVISIRKPFCPECGRRMYK